MYLKIYFNINVILPYCYNLVIYNIKNFILYTNIY